MKARQANTRETMVLLSQLLFPCPQARQTHLGCVASENKTKQGFKELENVFPACLLRLVMFLFSENYKSKLIK